MCNLEYVRGLLKKDLKDNYNLTIMESPKLATDNRFKKNISKATFEIEQC